MIWRGVGEGKPAHGSYDLWLVDARFNQAEVITRMGGLLFPQRSMNHLLILRSSDPGRRHEYSKAMGILLKDFVHGITGRNQAGLACSRERSEMQSSNRARTP